MINDASIITEVKKFDWQKALEKTSISNDLSLVKSRNDKVDETKIMSTNTADETRLKQEDIEKMVSMIFRAKKGLD